MVSGFVLPTVQGNVSVASEGVLDKEALLVSQALKGTIDRHFSCKRDGVSRSIYVVKGRVYYGLKEKVGQGSRASVKKAECDGKVIARRIQRITNAEEKCKARKTQELLERLKDKPGIEKVMDVIEYPKTIITTSGKKLTIMQRVTFSELQECDLHEVLAKGEKNLSLETRYSYLDQLFSALQALEGAHGDLKPENILVKGDKVTLSDFEEYHAPDEKGSHCRGSLWWMAPEAFLSQAVDVKKLDVWALGIIALNLFVYPKVILFPWFRVMVTTREDQMKIHSQMTDDNVERVLEKAYEGGEINAEQKALVSCMMCVDSQERWSIDRAAQYFREALFKR